MRKIAMLAVCGSALALLDPPGALAVRTVSLDAALGSAAGLGAWLICAYLALCTACSVLGRAPGLLGRVARWAGSAITPPALRGVIGLTCSLGITVAGPARAEQCPASCPVVSVDRPAADTPPPSAPAPASPAPRHWAQPAFQSAAVIVVQRGDSLWSIAARRLGAHPSAAAIALRWPRWYATNRQVIGPNPNLLFTGERLTPPDS